MIKKITLIGAGLTGPLLATYLANRGYEVDIYERRPDMRKESISAGRSINLAMTLMNKNSSGTTGTCTDIFITAPGGKIHTPIM